MNAFLACSDASDPSIGPIDEGNGVGIAHNALQGGSTCEGPRLAAWSPDLGHAGGDVDGSERVGVCEGSVVDVGDAGGQVDAGQSGVVREHPVVDHTYCRGEHH